MSLSCHSRSHLRPRPRHASWASMARGSKSRYITLKMRMSSLALLSAPYLCSTIISCAPKVVNQIFLTKGFQYLDRRRRGHRHHPDQKQMLTWFPARKWDENVALRRIAILTALHPLHTHLHLQIHRLPLQTRLPGHLNKGMCNQLRCPHAGAAPRMTQRR